MTTIEELNQREAEEIQLVRDKYAKLRGMVPHVRAIEQPTIDGNPYSEYFHYDGAKLVWKCRPEHHFNSKRGMNTFNSQFSGKTAGSKSYSENTAYIQVKVGKKRKSYLEHRIIWEMHYGAISPGLHVDHINGNGLDNRIDNLRLVSKSGNAKNSRISSANTSGVTGVYWSKRVGKWVSQITAEGKRITIGAFENIVDASEARKSAEIAFGYHKNHGSRRCKTK